MKTGRKDSKESHAAEMEEFIPNPNDTMSSVLSRFQSVGIDTEGAVALLGKSFHSISETDTIIAFLKQPRDISIRFGN